MALDDKIREALARVAKAPIPTDPNASLFDTGVIDSFDLVDFVADLEKEFNIKVPDNDLHPSKFESLAKICCLPEQPGSGVDVGAGRIRALPSRRRADQSSAGGGIPGHPGMDRQRVRHRDAARGGGGRNGLRPGRARGAGMFAGCRNHAGQTGSHHRLHRHAPSAVSRRLGGSPETAQRPGNPRL